MKLSWLSRFMATVLTTLLFLVVVTIAAGQTVLNTQYLESELQSQQAYSKLSTAISKDISKQADAGQAQDAVTTQLQSIITPQVLQQRLSKTLNEIQAYYKGNGPVPTLDVSDLVNQAEAAGLPAPNDPKLQQPIKLTAATKAKHYSNAAKAVGAGVIALIVVLIVGLVAIARKTRNYKPLCAVLVSLGIMLSVTGGSLLIVPRIFNKLYTFNPATNPFGALAHDIALGVLHDYALHLLIPGLAILVVGIVARLLVGRAGKRVTPVAEATPAPAATRPITQLPTTAPPTDAPDTPVSAPPVPRASPPKPTRKIQL